MELTDRERQLLQLVVQQLWRKGAYTPDEAAIAQGFTQFVERALKVEPKKEGNSVGK